MWQKYPKQETWYRIVRSGFVTLTFLLREENSFFVLQVENLPEVKIQMCVNTLEDAKINADQHVKHALIWN